MLYKDHKFEIDDSQLKFENNTPIILLAVFIATGLAIGMGSSSILFVVIGISLGILLVLSVLFRLYWKNTIDLCDIDFVKIQMWDKSIDKDRNFWGIGRYKYHFPKGFNKKTNPKVIFVHIKERNAAVGFVPVDSEKVISVLKDKGIKITAEPPNVQSA